MSLLPERARDRRWRPAHAGARVSQSRPDAIRKCTVPVRGTGKDAGEYDANWRLSKDCSDA